MNAKLLDLYSRNWNNFSSAMQSILLNDKLETKPTNPLLLYINEDEYNNADIKIMVYGKETNDWMKQFQNEIEPTLAGYDEFVNGGECWGYGRHFWNGVSRFFELLQEKYPDKKISLIWNNIVKVGKFGEKGFPPHYIYEVEREHFSIINEELKIVKPTIVLFLTGPDYDEVIEANFGKLQYSKLNSDFSEREIAKMLLPGIPFTFRTYHPQYLWFNDINNYFNSIIDKIDINDNKNIYLKTIEQLNEELDEIKAKKLTLFDSNHYEEVARLRDKEKMLQEALEFKM